MSISSFFGNMFRAITGRPSAAEQTHNFVTSGAANDFREASDSNLQLAAVPTLVLAQGLQKVDPASLSSAERSQLHDSLKSFLDTWKARSPAQLTIKPTVWYENTKTGEKKWNAPLEGLDSKNQLNPQSFQQAFTWLANQAPQKFGFSDLAGSTASVDLTRVPFDSFDNGKGAPPPSALQVSIRFS